MIPAYITIRDYLSEQIAQGAIGLNEKLPSERELVDRFTSTRITVREALAKLEAEGVIYRSNRRGWFVSPPRLQYDPSTRINFYKLAEQQDRVPSTRLLALKKIKGPAEIREKFGLTHSKEKLIEATRVRFLEERPVLFEQIYVVESRFPGLTKSDMEGSFTKLMDDNYGYKITSESNTIRVAALYDEEAEVLQLNAGAPCLNIHRQRNEKNGTLLEYDVEYWVHSALEICIGG